MRNSDRTPGTVRPGRATPVAAVVVLLAGGLLMTNAAHAQQAERLTSLKLKAQSAGKLQSDPEWRKVVAASGDTIRPQKGFQLFRVGDIILVTNEGVPPPRYETLKQGVSSNAIHLGKGQCVVLKQICACASTLIDNMYGGGADDDCRFQGDPGETTCGGAGGCCAYFRQEEPVECPGG